MTALLPPLRKRSKGRMLPRRGGKPVHVLAAAVIFLSGVAFVASSAPLAPACVADKDDQPRLVINSHGDYSKPLSQLLASLRSIGFVDFCRVLVVVGGSTRDSPPEQSATDGIVYVHKAINAHDYTAFAAIDEYQDHPLVRGLAFLYLHDTCLAHAGFVHFWDSLPEQFRSQPMRAIVPAGYFTSNICVLGRGVVQRFKGAFSRNITKAEAIGMELQGRAIVKDFGAEFVEAPERTLVRTLLARSSCGGFPTGAPPLLSPLIRSEAVDTPGRGP